MRICIPVIGFDKTGGYRVLSELANAWTNQGHEVSFLSHYHSKNVHFPTNARVFWIDEKGNPVRENAPHDEKPLLSLPILLNALRVGINRHFHDCDILMANHNLTAWPVAFSKISGRKFYYVQAYEPEYYHPNVKWRYLILKILAVFTYWIIKEKIANAPLYLSYKFLRCQSWIPPGVDFSKFYPASSMGVPASGSEIVLGCIGRSEPEKGTKFALEAYFLLREMGLPVKLRVAFGGVPHDLAVSKNIEIVMPKNDRELGEYYRSVNILIAPGLVQHGAPHYPVMEAMACGIPVVTTGYMPANAENAWIVPVENAAAIAEAIKNIISDPVQAEAKVSRAAEVIERFQWEKISREFIERFSK